jgi:hypothetical protein
MVNDVAFVVFHESVDGEPVCTEEGEADRVHVGGGGAAVTVTVVEHVTVPPEPEAVPVYVVVTAGETDREPEVTGVTKPILWLIEKVVAFVVFHESVEEPPV